MKLLKLFGLAKFAEYLNKKQSIFEFNKHDLSDGCEFIDEATNFEVNF